MPAAGPFQQLPTLPGVYSTAIDQGQPGGLPLPTDELVGFYATASDLFGEKVDKVLCSKWSGGCFWQPVRTDWINVVAMSANQAGLAFRPLRTPSIIRLTGNLTLGRSVALDPTYAWPGMRVNIGYDGLLGAFGLTITGLGLGGLSTLPLLSGARRDFIYTGSTYEQF